MLKSRSRRSSSSLLIISCEYECFFICPWLSSFQTLGMSNMFIKSHCVCLKGLIWCLFKNHNNHSSFSLLFSSSSFDLCVCVVRSSVSGRFRHWLCKHREGEGLWKGALVCILASRWGGARLTSETERTEQIKGQMFKMFINVLNS